VRDGDAALYEITLAACLTPYPIRINKSRDGARECQHWDLPQRSGVGTVGTGGTLYPQVQDLYPLYPQVKDAAYVNILSKRLLTTRLYKVRTNLYPPLTRSTQPCIPPGSLNRVPASAGVRAGMSPLPGGR